MDWCHFAHCRGVSSLRGGRTIVLSALFSLFAHPNALLPCLTPKLSRVDSTGGMEQIKQPLWLRCVEREARETEMERQPQ